MYMPVTTSTLTSTVHTLALFRHESDNDVRLQNNFDSLGDELNAHISFLYFMFGSKVVRNIDCYM